MDDADKATRRGGSTVWLDANVATMTPAGEPYGLIADAAIAVKNGRSARVGAASPAEIAAAASVHRCGGRLVTPGLVDCHTHLVYGGSRAREFEQRLSGVSYEEIARRGGGIVSTVRATRAAPESELVLSAGARLRALLEEGVTTVEVKSGYGLDVETEAKMLRAARALAARHPVTVRTTFLGAHALAPEYRDRPDAYIDFVCRESLPAVVRDGLADAVDAFCERIAFSAEQTARVFAAAQRHGLPLKLHADQLSDGDGAQLAAAHGALSADHLEYTSARGVEAMAAVGTVAVLLPGAFYFLRETRVPPVDLLRRHAVPIAVATDSNPGSSPVTSLLLMLNMACTLFGLTPEEALAGVTRNAARALGIDADVGTLETGKTADFVVWDVAAPAELAYRIGFNPCRQVIKAGEVVLDRS